MRIRQFQVDAFAERVFEGNPAAVCPLDHWLDDDVLQSIAEENNLSETAFFVPSERGYELRWFTPVTEVDLCGHATLATAHVLFNEIGHIGPRIIFKTRSGDLFVEKDGAGLKMDFPSCPPVAREISELITQGLGKRPVEVLAADDYMAVFESEEIVRAIRPDQTLLAQLDLRGVIITAPGIEVDFVSRFFAPRFGIPEDPVTGSAHCALTPYWASKLGKPRLIAQQVSKRGGKLTCEIKDDRVIITGSATTFMDATILIG